MFFNIGPMELIVLAVVGLIVLGPDRLPGLARDAARMIKTLREMATGARTQLREELGPEFADLDLRNLNPRTAIQRAVLGDDIDLSKLNPRSALQRSIFGDDEPVGDQLSDDPPYLGAPPPADQSARVSTPVAKPLGRGEQAPFDADAT
jgi:sec-independent protein translocase protein TatB